MQHPPESVRKATFALYVAAALAALAAVTIIVGQATGGGLAQQLRETYPQRSGSDIGTAESSILTYLFTLATLGAALFLWMARASRRGRRWVRGTGAGLVVLGSVLAAYNFSQPHPLLGTVAGVLPCVSALAAIALLWSRDSSSYFTNTGAETTA